MDINQLRYFIEICKLGSMSKAAVSLNISPQGISAAIRAGWRTSSWQTSSTGPRTG